MESLWVPPTCGSNSFRIDDEPALTMNLFSTSRLASSVLVLAVLSGGLLSACSGGPEPSGAPSGQPPSPTSAPALVPGGSPTGVPAQEPGQPPSPTSAPALVPGGSPTGVPTQEPGQPPSPTSAPALVPGGSPTGVPAQESVPDSRFGPGVYAFSLPSAQGPEVSLSQYLGERHVVLVFYRAWW